ncbi:MAG: ribosome-associated ATPase/putative transporter RbbA [Victivallaceae bacterium]|nr:ribosome-associated ATPase/putative transporter RbbA [Victivallaceae bacterium]
MKPLPREKENRSAVCFRHLSYRYGKTQALKDVSFTLAPQKLVGLIGPDGVGKSTLLSLISGARAIQKGDLFVLGGNLRSIAHRQKVCPRIAYMPQGLGKNLYFTLTVEENLQFFARLFGHDAAERRRRIDHLTKSTGLYPFLDRPAGKLSGGMKQKLGLCCALIHDPDLLILDEPTTGVDPLARRQFWDLIDRIRNERKNMSVIVATAYMDEAQRFDQLIAMDGGLILATGTPQELLAKTQQKNLDAAFIQLLPESKRQDHHTLVVPPLPDSADNEIAIKATGLTKRFGKFTAVDHVSFEIPRGEIFGFLGSNGCGKTTTMRMLTGLLPVTEGNAEIFGVKADHNTMASRLNLGYMTQSFSLYGELTVRQNLELYAHLYRIPADQVSGRVDEMLQRFQLQEVSGVYPKSLPLGIKQRLSLAAAVIHHPRLLILDEPTSGVDPVARDTFWELIIELSRRDKVTIFITTHFMNEAERCDRVSLMHQGRSLACDTPVHLVKARQARDLEEAFISFLEEASGTSGDTAMQENIPVKAEIPPKTPWWHFFAGYFNIRRWYSCMWRETLELARDPIRATLALFGAMLLMAVTGYGISMDVENLRYAVWDNDHSELSIDYANNIAGSRYFIEHPPIINYQDIDRRMSSGELSLVVEIPPDFGQKLEHGLQPEIAFWVDGAMPMRAETINGYVSMLHQEWLQNFAKYKLPLAPGGTSVAIQVRYHYNPDVRSLPAMVPAVIPLLLLMIPAVLAALAVVREKENGSIINLYVTPLTRLEFLLGKQCPYVIFATFSGILQILMAVFVFDVPVKGSVPFLLFSILIYSILATGMGLLASSVTRSQIAVIFLTMLGTILPASQLCGLITPVRAQNPLAQTIAAFYPTTYMLLICRGVFNKSLGFAELFRFLLPMLVMVPCFVVFGVSLLKKQES